MNNIINKKDFIESLTEEEFNAGTIKFNIPNEHHIYSYNGEGVWGWVSSKDKEKYHDNNYYGTITAILLNNPFTWKELLNWGDEVRLKCLGCNRPILDPEWVKENL